MRARFRDLVGSVLVVLAVAGAAWALVPTPNDVTIQRVDVAAAARRAQSRLGFSPAVPQGLPIGWTAVSAQVEDGGSGLMTWHVGYRTADGSFAGLDQVDRPSDPAVERWLTMMDSGADPRTPIVLGGTTWERRVNPLRSVTALISRGSRRTTLVTSKTDGPAAEVLARSLPAAQR